jgi:hypothetical protein
LVEQPKLEPTRLGSHGSLRFLGDLQHGPDLG